MKYSYLANLEALSSELWSIQTFKPWWEADRMLIRLSTGRFQVILQISKWSEVAASLDTHVRDETHASSVAGLTFYLMTSTRKARSNATFTPTFCFTSLCCRTTDKWTLKQKHWILILEILEPVKSNFALFYFVFLLSLCAWFSQMRIRSRRWSTRGLREQPSLWWWRRKAPGSTSTIWLVRRRARRTSTPAEVRWGESKTVTWPWTTRPQIKDNLLHHTHAHLHLSWNSCRLIPLRYLPSLTYSLLSSYSSFRQERGC